MVDTPIVKELVKDFEGMSNQHHQRTDECFREFLDCCECALTGQCLAQKRAECSVPEERMKQYAAIFAKLIMPVWEHDDWVDYLGVVFCLIGCGDKHLGQFFTPWNVSMMMAKMLIGEPDLDSYTVENPMKVLDPACGSGGMLLAAAFVLPREFVQQGRMHATGIDLDRRCCQMLRINLHIRQIRGDVVHGDALTMPMDKDDRAAIPPHIEEQNEVKLAQLELIDLPESARPRAVELRTNQTKKQQMVCEGAQPEQMSLFGEV